MRKLLFVISLLFFFKSIAQETAEYVRCATPRIYKNNLKKVSKAESFQSVTFSGVIVIPVVFHVVHNVSDGSIQGTNISDDLLISQIRVLNEDFRRKAGTYGFNTNPVGADVEIEFQLAKIDPNCNPTNGITRHFTTVTAFDPYTNDIKQFEPWPGNEYLNIWIGNFIENTLGIAQFPNYSGLPGLSDIEGDLSTDGICIRYNAVGVRKPNSVKDRFYLGRTATHEIGHWLGLLHTWGDAVCGTDYCDDTPPEEQDNPNTDCREVFSFCNGVSSKVMIENYLDYSSDICMNIFTQDQKSRMWQTMTTSPDRANILKFMEGGINLKTVRPATVPLPITENFESKTENVSNKSANCFGVKSSFVSLDSPLSGSLFSSGKIDNSTNDQYNISFDYAYSSENQIDTLFLIANTGCKSGSYIVSSLTGTDLITYTISGTTQPDCNQWKTGNFTFTSPFNYIDVSLTINSQMNGYLYIDNVKLSSTRKTSSRVDGLQTKVIGNPIYDYTLNIEVLFEDKATLELAVFNVWGEKVYEITTSEAISDVFKLKLPEIAQGVYFVRSKVNNQISIKRILIL